MRPPVTTTSLAGNSPVYGPGWEFPLVVAQGVAGKPGLFLPGRASATVILLLEHGADAGAPDHTLQTPLHRAVAPFLRSPSPDTVTLLVDGGAHINAADQAGDTPLHLAAKGSESWHQPPTVVETVRLLLDSRARLVGSLGASS